MGIAMKVLWLLPQALFQDRGFIKNPRQSLLDCKVASIRLRTGVAVGGSLDAGFECVFASPEFPESLAIDVLENVQVCVIGKYFFQNDPQQWLIACRLIKSRGIKLVVDISEFPFASSYPQIVHFYTEVLPMVDVLTVNSERMSKLLAEVVDFKAIVIEDAVLNAAVAPRFAPDRTVELLWFGHRTNLGYLQQILPTLLSFTAQRPCCLTLVTAVDAELTTIISQFNRQLPQSFRLRLEQWSIPRMQRALQVCDLVLIPGDSKDARKAGVSANRIVETLQAGRLPIASALESYLPFVDSAYLGPDLSAGIAWALKHPDQVLAKILNGQAQVSYGYTVERIAAQWCGVIAELANATPVSS